jgi:hypothetical protein
MEYNKCHVCVHQILCNKLLLQARYNLIDGKTCSGFPLVEEFETNNNIIGQDTNGTQW